MASKLTLPELQKQRKEYEAMLFGFESMYNSYEDPNSPEALELLGAITQTKNDLEAVNRSIERLEGIESEEQKRNAWKREKPKVDDIIRANNIGYIIPENKYIYCRDFGTTGVNNVMFEIVPATAIIRTLSKLAGFRIGSRDYNEITDYFEETGRTYHKVTSSFNKQKWNEREIYNKMSIVRDMWLKPDYENSNSYDPALDILLYCVCGGKQENIDHLEQWIAYKYLNPDKNANIPNLDLGGQPGGNGKGTLIQLLKTIFGPMCVVQAHKEELEKFNAQWEMAVILYYDEPEEKELAASKLKQATGAEDMRIEKKGIDATMADRNYNFIFMSNNRQGVVKLSGGSSSGEDRRYSVINTNLVLVDEVAAKLGHDQALEWVNTLAQRTVKDRDQIARWLAHIITKHQVATISILPALHGQDYLDRFETQKDSITEAFDRITPVLLSQGIFPQYLMCEIVRTITGQQKLIDKTINTRWADYVRRNKLPVESQARVHYKEQWNGRTEHTWQRTLLVANTSKNTTFNLDEVMLELVDFDAIGTRGILTVEKLAI